MNKTKPSLDVYINIVRDVYVLRQFNENGLMQTGRWMNVPADIRARFTEQGYVKIGAQSVCLTPEAVEVKSYKESKG